MGLVAQVFDEGHLNSLRGHLAIGHTRYSTTGSSVWENAQPTFRSTAAGSIALGHNGNLTNTRELLELVEKRAAESGQLPYDGDGPTQDETRRWRDGIAAATPPCTAPPTPRSSRRCSRRTPTARSSRPRSRCCPQLRGAFSLVFMDEDDAVRRARPAGHPAAGAGPAGARLGGRQRDRRAGHRRRRLGPRDRARRADRDRRARPALAAVRRGRAQGLPVRVRLPRPARTPRSPAARARDPGRGRPPAGRRGARSRPTW